LALLSLLAAVVPPALAQVPPGVASSAAVKPSASAAAPATPTHTSAPATPAATAPPASNVSGEEAAATFGEVYSVETILVPVAVRGERAGERLGKDRFTLSVDGKPIKIESFESDTTAPLSLVVLQDLSGSMAEPGKMEISREMLQCFLDTARKGDELSLATFAMGKTEVDVPLTGDVEPIREAMGLWEPWGTTGLYDAVGMLPEISIGSSGKRAALLVTDGVDNVSTLSPVEAEKLVQSADLPVYVIALSSHDPKTATDPNTLRYADLLAKLAEHTGGRYYDLDAPAQARRTCASILGELRHQYLLGFSLSGSGPSAYHPIRVELRGAGRHVSLIHRRGYRGTAPSLPS
jgi:VWFA-related protein